MAQATAVGTMRLRVAVEVEQERPTVRRFEFAVARIAWVIKLAEDAAAESDVVHRPRFRTSWRESAEYADSRWVRVSSSGSGSAARTRSYTKCQA